jgi:hypothetical protein
MQSELSIVADHLAGDQSQVVAEPSLPAAEVDSWAGTVRVEWDAEAAATSLGQLPFFIDFLKTSGLFDGFVSDCPLAYASPNAPKTRDLLGTAMLSMLAGHRRYAHISALRFDGVLPDLLGMKKVVSEDSVRRGLKKIDPQAGAGWVRRHLLSCVEPLLSEPWILDADTTIKPIYGHQEGAEIGYNPKKPGRPSHCYHTYAMAGTRLILDVELSPGDEHTSNYAAPALWALLDRLGRECWPRLLRGDAGFGVEPIMAKAEARGLAYLFKLRLTKNVRRMVEKLAQTEDWIDAGAGFQAKESFVRLTGWREQRRAIVLRRRIDGDVALSSRDDNGQLKLSFAQVEPDRELWHYQVLVTNLAFETSAFGQLYRDRGDDENIFDEMKNQWGWGGFTTHDLARCRLAAQMNALFFDWWNIFARLGEPDRHREAITSRPLLMSAVATRARHARRTTIRVTSAHAESRPAAKALTMVASFLRDLMKNAEQLTSLERWRAILRRAFKAFLDPTFAHPPPRFVPT